ncbi:MAG: hypothetical protein KBC84_10840, partial [Proteobacteria bacterium]|nr:hypothetical protein [Pseudomonadota bacterium]
MSANIKQSERNVTENISSQSDTLLPNTITAVASEASQILLRDVQLIPKRDTQHPTELKEFLIKSSNELGLLENEVQELYIRITDQEKARERSVISRVWHHATGSENLIKEEKQLVANLDRLNELNEKRTGVLEEISSAQKSVVELSKDPLVIKEQAALHLVRLQAVRAQEIAFISRLLVVESNGENRLSNHTLNYIRSVLIDKEQTAGSITDINLAINTLQSNPQIAGENSNNNQDKIALLRTIRDIQSSKGFQQFLRYIKSEDFRDDSVNCILKHDTIPFIAAVAGAVLITGATGGLSASIATSVVSFTLKGIITKSIAGFAANYLVNSGLMATGTIIGQETGKEINNLCLYILESQAGFSRDQRLTRNGALIGRIGEFGTEAVLSNYSSQIKNNVVVNMGTQALGLSFGKLLKPIISPVANISSKAVTNNIIFKTISDTTRSIEERYLHKLASAITKEVGEETLENLVADLANLSSRENQLAFLKKFLIDIGLPQYADAGGTILSALMIAATGKGPKNYKKINQKGIPTAAYEFADAVSNVTDKFDSESLLLPKR